ncbi:MAG: hypothetical protein ACJA2S_005439, partial [Cyclobacteriaceae bacterium]
QTLHFSFLGYRTFLLSPHGYTRDPFFVGLMMESQVANVNKMVCH